MENILENCESVKFLFIIEYSNIKATRAFGFKKNIDFLKKLFLNEYQLIKYKNSVLIIVTKQNKEASLKKIRNVLKKSETPIYKELADRFFLYNPIDPLETKKEDILDRQPFIEKLKNMNFIKEKFFEMTFNLEQNCCIENIFKFVKDEIFLNSQLNESEELIKSFTKLDIFQNSKNSFILNKFEDINEILNPTIEILFLFSSISYDLNVFPVCEIVLNSLYQILKRNQNSSKFKEYKILEKKIRDKKNENEILEIKQKKMDENEFENYEKIIKKKNNLLINY